MDNYLGSNIKTLRIENRLSIEELASKSGLSVERISELEAGATNLTRGEMRSLCPILKISEEDFLSRDIKTERENAEEALKHSKTRTNYNWYYGNTKKRLYYLIPICVIILVGFLAFVSMNNLGASFDPAENLSAFEKFVIVYSGYFYAATMSGAATAIFTIIELFKRHVIRFQYWMIFIIFSCFTVIEALGVLLIIPFLVYSFIQLFKKPKH